MQDTEFTATNPLTWHSLPDHLKPSRVAMRAHKISAGIPAGIRSWLIIERDAQSRGAYRADQIESIAAHWLHRRAHWLGIHNATA